jgi:uncharacterized radical SAM superfamily Fe-S cluster-containing enzyme
MQEIHADKIKPTVSWTDAVRNRLRGHKPLPAPAVVTTQATPKGLPKTVPSMCPECRRRIDAKLFEKDGKVFMGKECPTHGYVEDLVYGDVDMYGKMEKWTFEDAEGIKNPQVPFFDNCPDSCGLCSHHISPACMTIIDLTNRCNLTCPYCFANANVTGYDYTPVREQITAMLQNVSRVRPRRCHTIQFSGGEPTIHPDFLWACSEAKRVGFEYCMAASNGITFAKDPELARKAKNAGLDAVYLQFDGVSDRTYQEIRGAKLLKIKRACLDNCRKAGLRATLVPTLARGVSNDQIGDVVKTAIDYLEIVNGVSFQPVSFTGRISYEERIRQRYTISDVCWDLYEQTGIAHPMRDWYPLSFVSPLSRLMEALSNKDIMTISCHADCGLGCYLIVNREGEAWPITRFIDLEGAMTELNELSKKIKSIFERPLRFAQAYNVLKKYYRQADAPPGMKFGDFLGALGPTLIPSRTHIGKARKWRLLVLLSMHFQDVYNFNFDRLRRCVIHYAAPNGMIYPFCAYNSGPSFRERIEAEYSKPIDSAIR